MPDATATDQLNSPTWPPAIEGHSQTRCGSRPMPLPIPPEHHECRRPHPPYPTGNDDLSSFLNAQKYPHPRQLRVQFAYKRSIARRPPVDVAELGAQ